MTKLNLNQMEILHGGYLCTGGMPLASCNVCLFVQVINPGNPHFQICAL